MPAESETPPFTTQADEPAPNSPDAPAGPSLGGEADRPAGNAHSDEHPEYFAGAAFAGGFVLARAIRWLGRNRG